MDFEKPPTPSRQRLVEVLLDEASISRRDSDAAHDREVAIYDLIEENHFGLDGRDDGPYKLMLAIVEDRLAFHVSVADGDGTMTHLLSLSPLKRIIKDYFTVCESYYQAIRTAPPSRIQAIDMGRRALHDEGSRTLTDRLRGKIIVDHDTARRLFTLICALIRKA